jgi:hypothetical protein
MKIGWDRLMKLIVVFFLLLSFGMLIIGYEFPTFQLENLSQELIKVEMGHIGSEASRFLWNYRLIDLIAQAFVLFVTAACAVAILRTGTKK